MSGEQGVSVRTRAHLPPVLGAGIRQPDGYSCGAQSVVMARLLLRPPAQTLSPQGVRDLVVAAHRRLVRVRGATGLQLPWPRRLGTPPWAVAREMQRLTGVRHRVLWVRTRDRGIAWSALVDVLRKGGVAPIYAGSPTLPRHVVLAVGLEDDSVFVHDPASGRLLALEQRHWRDGDRITARWSTPWWVVLPTTE